ncbi:DUF4238 domain-containing protein [Nocardia sp. NPDC005825]|uniref:DUF4238 domain-containing protein n=1 Tax=unclassified Nocardia TaxID=2637762 RepID=UPI0033E3A6F9
MTSNNRWLSDAEIEKSKEETRKNNQTTVEHHYVPRMYLKRWASDAGEVRFTNMTTNHSDCVPPEVIAVESNFYQISASDINSEENPDMWFETHMGRIEDRAAHWLRALDEYKLGRIKDTNLISNLSVFIGLQSQRTKRGRQGELTINDAIDKYGAETLLNIPGFLQILCSVQKIPYSPQRHSAIVAEMIRKSSTSSSAKPKAIESAIGVWRNSITPMMEDERLWWIVDSETPMITGDEPVLRIPTRRNSRELPVSFLNAKLIVFPVSPTRAVIMSHKNLAINRPFTITSTEVTFLNREFAYSCNELVFEHPDSNITTSMRVPCYPTEATDLPTTVSTVQELMRILHPPTRWSGASHAPQWPLARWTSS